MPPAINHKSVKCPIHGYIKISADLCKRFIDTPIFQRLKDISQTSMRPLYPSAYHNRFVHSLGVYHLATIAFDSLLKNTTPALLTGVDLEEYKLPFQIAALMHDCGHAPFSHIFESYYNKRDKAKDLLYSLVDAEFHNDYKEFETLRGGAAPHELFSAAIFLKFYKDDYQQLCPNVSPVFIARMIVGCIHYDHSLLKHQIENALIMMLNGKDIDVDKIDYIMRDTWSSGVDSVSIDIHRLLSALMLEKYIDDIVPVFNKSALSVIQNVVEGRNFLYKWIYSHHTVSYYSNLLLPKAVDKLFNIMFGADALSNSERIFSIEPFENIIVFPNGIKFYLPSDSDFYSLFKQYSNDPSFFIEKDILSRKTSLVPLWKSFTEFDFIFKSWDSAKKRSLRPRIKNILASVITEPDFLNRIEWIDVRPKLLGVEENDILINLNGEILRASDILKFPAPQVIDFFYVFIPREKISLIGQCVNVLKTAHIA
jgi:hypothetical protein